MSARHRAALALVGGGESDRVAPLPDAPAVTAAAAAAVAAPSQFRAGQDGGAGLRRFLVQQWKRGKLPAEDVCTMAWHATRAGGSGVADLAVDPKYRHQAEHLVKALQVRTPDCFYMVDLPLWDHEEEVRKVWPFPMSLPHEEFARGYAACPGDFDVEGADDLQLPPSYFDHPCYRDHGAAAVPIGYFPMRYRTRRKTASSPFIGAPC